MESGSEIIFESLDGCIPPYGEKYSQVLPGSLEKVLETRVLPGNSVSPEVTCGMFRRQDECSVDPKHYTKSLHFSCKRATCPVCYEDWAEDLALSCSDRLLGVRHSLAQEGLYVGAYRHHIFSPPQAWAIELARTYAGYKELCKAHDVLLQGLGLSGGASIFHIWRFQHDDGSECEDAGACQLHHVPVEGPHFHDVALGKVDAGVFAKSGWVHKNKGPRNSLIDTLKYLLSHCGLYLRPDGSGQVQNHALRYFGILSYRKVSKVLIRTVKGPQLCPKCRAPVVAFGVENDLGYPRIPIGPVSVIYRVFEYRVRYPGEKRPPAELKGPAWVGHWNDGTRHIEYPSDLDWMRSQGFSVEVETVGHPERRERSSRPNKELAREPSSALR